MILVDTGGRYVGLLPTPEAFTEGLDPSAPVAGLARQPRAVLTPELNIKEAMTAFDRTETETLAVVDNPAELRVLGVLTETYATRRYAEELDKANRGLTGD